MNDTSVFLITFFALIAIPSIILMQNMKTYHAIEKNPQNMTTSEFTLSPKRGKFILAVVLYPILALLFAFFVMRWYSGEEPVSLSLIIVFVIGYINLIILIKSSMGWSLIVSGDNAKYYSFITKQINFTFAEIVRVEQTKAYIILVLKNEKTVMIEKRNIGTDILIKRLQEEKIEIK